MGYEKQPPLAAMPSRARDGRARTAAQETRYLDTSNVTAARRVEFLPTEKLTAGSSHKAGQAIQLVRSVFRQRCKCSVTQGPIGITIDCPEVAETAILQLCAIAEEKLSRLQREPLTAKMVQEVLSITAPELRRWSKDGRMPTSGRAFFSQGRKQVGLFLYSPKDVCELALQPEQIAKWRHADRGCDIFDKESS